MGIESLEKTKVFKIKDFSLYIIPKFTILAQIKNLLSKLIWFVSLLNLVFEEN